MSCMGTPPATAWDDATWDGGRARGWTVMGTLRARQRALRRESQQEAARHVDSHDTYLRSHSIMSRLPSLETLAAEIIEHWTGGPTVLAFLFAQPDSSAVQMLDARGEYFDIRTAETWTLFFPGYYSGKKDDRYELELAGARRVGQAYAEDWYFKASEFDSLRKYIEDLSERRWEYSGGTDLVLVNGLLPSRGEPIIDWDSTISGQLTDHKSGMQTITLANAIERITRDLEMGTEDGSYGVGEITDKPSPPKGHSLQELMINALGGIAAALGLRAIGM